jgi:chromosome segregation ATPase
MIPVVGTAKVNKKVAHATEILEGLERQFKKLDDRAFKLREERKTILLPASQGNSEAIARLRKFDKQLSDLGSDKATVGDTIAEAKASLERAEAEAVEEERKRQGQKIRAAADRIVETDRVIDEVMGQLATVLRNRQELVRELLQLCPQHPHAHSLAGKSGVSRAAIHHKLKPFLNLEPWIGSPDSLIPLAQNDEPLLKHHEQA